MKVIGILAQKGGVGKTTLAMNEAVAAGLNDKSCILIDLDPQASACKWGDLRGEKGWPTILSTQAERIPNVLGEARKQGVDLAIIDTPATSERASFAIITESDLVVIPCKPGFLDLHSIGTTIEMARFKGKQPWVVLSMVSSNGRSVADSAAETLQAAYDVNICPVRISQRVDYSYAVAAGQGVQEFNGAGKAAEEVAAFYAWMLQQVDDTATGGLADVSTQKVAQ